MKWYTFAIESHQPNLQITRQMSPLKTPQYWRDLEPFCHSTMALRARAKADLLIFQSYAAEFQKYTNDSLMRVKSYVSLNFLTGTTNTASSLFRPTAGLSYGTALIHAS